ncbi:MAG TPA: hypothetical protein VF514_04355 [Bacteroidota bacterium]
MTVFRIIAGLVILALIVGIGYDIRRRMKSWKAAGDFLLRQFRDFRHGRRNAGGLSRVRRIITIVSSGLFLILALTGFLPVIFLGIHLSGVLLVIHVTVAPLFAVSLSALALLWAHRLRFDESDWQIALGSGRWESSRKDALIRLALKVGFWIVLSLSLPLMLTVILGLFPLFGTEGEALLIRLHGYSALLLMMSALGELSLMVAYVEHSTEQPLKEQNP